MVSPRANGKGGNFIKLKNASDWSIFHKYLIFVETFIEI